MAEIWNGIFVWTGDYGVGKTTASVECGAKPEEIMFVDGDVKGASIVKELQSAGYEFGEYVNLIEMIEKYDRPWQAYPEIISLLEKVKPPIKVVIIDPETTLYNIFRAYVSNNPEEFDSKKAWRKSKGSGFQFYEGKISRTARQIEQLFLNRLISKVVAVHLTAHLKDKYDGGVPVGKIPSISEMIDRTANMICWLQHNPDHTTPIMLFVKQYGEKVVASDGKIRTRNITPRKAVPSKGEDSVWDVLNGYKKKPAHGREPLPSEIITEDDQWIVNGTLNDFQKQAWFARIKAKEQADQEAQEALQDKDSPFGHRVRELRAEGIMAPPLIKKAILAEIEAGELEGIDPGAITLDAIAKAL